MSTGHSKTCTKCGETKPLSDYYFENGKPRSRCKDCHRAKVYERSPEQIREINTRSRHKHSERHRERQRAYLEANREAVYARARATRAANADAIRAAAREKRKLEGDKIRAQTRARYQARRDEIRERERARRAANPEPYRQWERNYRQKNRDYVNAQARAYYAANPHIWESGRRAYAARKAGVEHAPYTRREIYDRDGGRCKICGKALPFEPNAFQLDHIVPISLRGPDTPANLQLTCPPCNRRKWATLEGQLHFAA